MAIDTVFGHPVTTAVIAGFLLVGVIGRIMKASFERIARWYLYISTFAVIIVMNSVFFPFIGGKDDFFRFAVELALSSVVLWWAFDAKKGELAARVKALFRKPIVIATTVFAAMFELACIFAYDAHAAFWSNYERGEGGFQLLHYYLFFLLLVFLFTEEEHWKRLFRLSFWATAGVILYGLAGNFNVAGFIGPYAGTTVPSGLWHQLVDGRFEGSLGNSAYLDAYLLFIMFYIGYLWTSSKIAGKLTSTKSWLYGVGLAVILFFFVIGQTRGAFLGLAFGLLAGTLYFVVASRGKVRKWGLLVFCILVLMGIGIYAIRNTAFIGSFPEGRLLQLSLSDTTAQTRIWVWGEAWKGFLERPVFGWGPENFTAVFDKFFNPKFYIPGQSSETWFDRAHSIYFDYLAETGILGLLSYLAIFVAVFAGLAKKFKKIRMADASSASVKHAAAENMQRGLLVALPIAYLVQGVAIFDVLPMYLCVFTMFAFMTHYASAKEHHHEHGG